MKLPGTQKLPGPDGVEAWCVALSACFINFLTAGLARMAGVLFVAFIDILQIDRRQASLPFSVRMSVRNLLGPIIGVLGQKYGVRVVSLFGGVVATLSSVVCFFATDILWVTIVWGAINGIGFALITTLPQVVIGQHFKKYRSTAAGMAFSGGCVGSFLFPVLIELLLHTYGLGGTFLIMGGIMMHTIPAAMILKKPTWLKEPCKDIKIFTVSNTPDSAEEVEKYSTNKTTNKKPKQFEDKKEIGILREHSESNQRCNIGGNGDDSNATCDLETQSVSDVNCDLLRNNRVMIAEILNQVSSQESSLPKSNILKCKIILESDIDLLCNQIKTIQFMKSLPERCENVGVSAPNVSKTTPDSRDEKVKALTDANRTLSPKISKEVSYILLAIEKVTKSDEKAILAHFQEKQNAHVSSLILELKKAYLASEDIKRINVFPTPSTNKTFSGSKSISCESEDSNSFVVHIRTALKLHRNPLFLLICLCRTVHILTFATTVTTIVDFSKDKGLPEEDGKYVIAALSVGDLMGRLCLGWITDRGYISVPRYMLLVMIAQGASTAVMSLMYSKASLMISIGVFGLLTGSVFVRHPVLISTYLGSKEQSIAMGSMNFLPGLTGFILPSYIGYFRDTIGSYNGILYTSGGLGVLVGSLWAFEPFFRKFSMPEDRDEEPPVV